MDSVSCKAGCSLGEGCTKYCEPGEPEKAVQSAAGLVQDAITTSEAETQTDANQESKDSSAAEGQPSLSSTSQSAENREVAQETIPVRAVLWDVVGGSNKDGLVVREGRELSSPQKPERLAIGSRLRQVCLGKGRLQFVRIAGQGPESGWVSLRVAGKELLAKSSAALNGPALATLSDSRKNNQVQDSTNIRSKERETISDLEPADPKSEDSRQLLPHSSDGASVLAVATPEVAQMSDIIWEVAGGSSKDGLIVRTGRELSSTKLAERLTIGSLVRQIRLENGRLQFVKLSGQGPSSGWVSLRVDGKDLLVKSNVKNILPSPSPTPKEIVPLLHTDCFGMLRGACRRCQTCDHWVCSGLTSVEWSKGLGVDTTVEDRRYMYDRKMRGYNDQRTGKTALCETCGCPAEEHLNLQSWLETVRRTAQPFRDSYEDAFRASGKHGILQAAASPAKKRKLPLHAQLTSSALKWDFTDIALHLLSYGVYNPEVSGRGPEKPCYGQAFGIVISVICPTSEKRQEFHPLLYENFRTQSYEPKELIVIDTGTRPSKFLEDTARTDSRVVYRFFSVGDSRETDPMAAVILADGHRIITGADIKRQKGMAFRPRSGWSLGFKRNLCIHLARGGIIAHFDDDDLYAPEYLRRMSEALSPAALAKQSPLSPGAEGLRPAAATLSEWHMMDIKDQAFGFFDPKTDPLVEENMRESFQHGYGFSFVYTKSAWDLVKFPDTEFSEDGDFTGRLQLKHIPIELVKSKATWDGLAAHTHHSDSTSGGELAGNVRLGCGVPVPEDFKALLPIVRQVAQSSKIRPGSQNALRAEMHRVLDTAGIVPTEVRWAEKQNYFRQNPGLGRTGDAPQINVPWDAAGNENFNPLWGGAGNQNFKSPWAKPAGNRNYNANHGIWNWR